MEATKEQRAVARQLKVFPIILSSRRGGCPAFGDHARVTAHSECDPLPASSSISDLQGNRLTIPTNDEYSVPQLRMVLRESAIILGREIPLQEWERL